MIAATATATAHSNSPQQQSTERPVAGIVNGDTVWLDDFSREVGRRAQLNQMGGDRTPSDVIEDTWRSMVRSLLIRQHAKELGVAVNKADIDSILLEDTPEFVQQGFVDENGRFDVDLLKAMMSNPDSLVDARATGASAESIAEQKRQIRQSMAGLYAQIGSQLVVQRLGERIKAQAVIDSSRLYSRYEDAATTANVDVIYMPCGDSPEAPDYEVLEAYYQARQDEYTSDRELRRLAVMTWPFEASPVDSTLMLNNILSFVGLLNSAASPQHRDSIWNEVASTVPAGATRLHPDSVSHEGFYSFLEGTSVGSAVGPIIHPTGVHVMLVDSVLTPKGASDTVYAIRLIITDVEPSRETVDSTLKEVNTALEMYENGRVLGEIAQTFRKEIQLSPYFGPDNKLYESYRLADAAFEAQVTQMLQPVDSPERGAVLGVVIDSVPPGPLPFEAAEERVLLDWQRETACTSREADMKKIRGIVTLLDDGRMFVGAPITGGTIFRDITVDPTGLIGDQILDPLASKAICNARENGIMGPFRGDAGWYIVNVHYVVKPNRDDYPLYPQLNGEALAEEQRVEHWNQFLDHLTDDANIEDRRYLYFRY